MDPQTFPIENKKFIFGLGVFMENRFQFIIK